MDEEYKQYSYDPEDLHHEYDVELWREIFKIGKIYNREDEMF